MFRSSDHDETYCLDSNQDKNVPSTILNCIVLLQIWTKRFVTTGIEGVFITTAWPIHFIPVLLFLNFFEKNTMLHILFIYFNDMNKKYLPGTQRGIQFTYYKR